MRNFTVLLTFTFFLSLLQAQSLKDFQNQNQFAGGLGLTWVNGEPYYLFNLSPDIAFGKFGIGLDINLRINKNGNIRKEDFYSTSDYFSLIKYLRYGHKRDKYYVRIGALERATLGQGNVVYYYNNRASYDNRKIGLELDIDFGKFGFESVYGDLSGKGLLGLRAYTRPLQFTNLMSVPILNKLELGATFATDLNDYSGVSNATIDTANRKLKIIKDEGKISIVGLDVSLPIVRTKVINFELYSNFAQILRFGSGASVGSGISFKGFGLLNVDLKLERWFNGDQFIPRYFNQFYEVQRLIVDSTKGFISSKANSLVNFKSPGNSYYGHLIINVLNFVQILGSYSRFDNVPESGVIRLETDLFPKGASYVLRAYYDKINIKDEKDLFRLDDRSMLTAEVGYKPLTYLLVSFLYQWTFEPERDKFDNIIGYKTQKRIEPRVTFFFPFAP